MFSILWRLALMIVLAFFMLIPLIGIFTLPVQLYLAISMGARIWKRVNAPA